jgi:hypothetical protein
MAPAGASALRDKSPSPLLAASSDGFHIPRPPAHAASCRFRGASSPVFVRRMIAPGMASHA